MTARLITSCSVLRSEAMLSGYRGGFAFTKRLIVIATKKPRLMAPVGSQWVMLAAIVNNDWTRVVASSRLHAQAKRVSEARTEARATVIQDLRLRLWMQNESINSPR